MPARARPRFPALDGVRALAVAGVLAAHTGVPGLGGGFIGVDVFFVLSGFLISSLLLSDRRRSGRVDLAAFWARRARRLLPAALVMISAVVVAEGAFAPDAVTELRSDALRATLWSSNWHWAVRGTDYFANGGNASPLQHTWSLAVEEQFYLAWPCVLALVWSSVRSVEVLRRRLLAIAIAVVALSAGATAFLGGHVPLGRIYFGTDTRAQELAVGAALAAVLAPTWAWGERRRRARRSPQGQATRGLPACSAGLSLLGLALVAHEADGSAREFRSGLMLVVALLAAGLIAGVVLDERAVVARLLAVAPMRAVGRLSYGIYLWHWPVFELLDGARTQLAPASLAVVRIATTVVLAAVSKAVLEGPAVRIRWPSRRVLEASGLAVSAAMVFAACAAPTDRPAPASTVAARTPDAPPVATSTRTHSTAPARTAPPHSPAATRRRGPEIVDVFGDSIAWTITHYLPATPGFDVLDHTVLGCGVVLGGPYRYFGQQYAANRACEAWPAKWRRQVRADRPDAVLLVVGRWETMDRVYGGSWTHVGDARFDAYLAGLLGRAIDELAATGARVIVTTEPYNRRGEQPDGQLYPEDDPHRVDQWNRIVRTVVGGHPAAHVADLNAKVCPHGQFTWSVDGVQVRSDGVHFTPEGVRWLTPWLLARLRDG